MAIQKMNNDMAVSPIVATLVLIVVAVIGAVAVGTIMGTFSGDVSKQANADKAASASSTEIIVAGSTTIDPVTLQIAKIYSANNPGVKVTSQATGSGAGFQAATLGVADVGAMSEDMSQAQKIQNPNMVQYRIGSGAIAVITNAASPALPVANAVSMPNDLFPAFNATAAQAMPANFTNLKEVVFRSDGSGTADTFFKAIGYDAQKTTVYAPTGATAVGKSGNAAEVQEVGSVAGSLGFADFGYVAGRTDVKILDVIDASGAKYTLTFDNGLNAAKALYGFQNEGKSLGTPKYPTTLIHPLYYITNGAPTSSIVKDYIAFAQSGSATPAFDATNTFALSKIF